MNIALGVTCLMAVAFGVGVTGTPEKQTISEHKTGDRYINESRVDIQVRYGACMKGLGGKCVGWKRDCPERYPLETKVGRPYCNKRRRCCYQAQGCVYGFKTYPNNAIVKQGCYELKCETGYWKIKGDDCQETCSGHNLLVTVKTGDGLYAGANSNVNIVFEDSNGKSTNQFKISDSSRGYLIRGGNDEHRVPIPKGFGRTATLKITLDNDDRIAEDWFCDHISVEDPRDNDISIFPIHQRIYSKRVYELKDDDTCSIPAYGPDQTIQEEYQFKYILTAAMVKDLPRDEGFSNNYTYAFYNQISLLESESKIRLEIWNRTNDINNIYYGYFPWPESYPMWRDDGWFGAQRVQGLLPNIIELCSEIPFKLGVTEDTVSTLLDQYTLQQALDNKKIFITDLHLLDGIEYGYNLDLDHASPIALFYLNKTNQLMPIAIQLWQMKGPNNPIYTPKDPYYTWLIAKMYYNNAEAQLHEIVHHLSYTHLIMDGIATSMNRQLAASNPVYKLLKPHFRFMMAINGFAETKLFNPGGYLDLFSIGTKGSPKLVAKAVPLFTFDRAIGSVESDARARGVWDKQVLPYYPFRDDAAAIYNITKKYVTTILNNCYDEPGSVIADQYLQNYHAELVRPRDQYGVGISGLPGSNTTGISDIGQVIDMVTMFIVQCSVGHAAVNFPQYDTYGYMPNYPSDMNEPPPNQKVDYTEEDIMKLLPDKINYVGVMGITTLLSWDGTNELGEYEKVYFNDPVSQEALEEYKNDLKEFSKEVQERNSLMDFPYRYLDPNFVPNAISI